MESFKTLIWIINVFASLAIIVLVLIQHGKGADAGASFGGGSGSAQGVFGSAGNANFLSRMTSFSAMIFFATCLALGYVHTNSNNGKQGGIDFSDVQQSTQVAAPQSASETK
ncbi:MAG: preprotein translocase subunit SecG [Neisseriaceae bacterium]|nr:preprotein translocase subunit SecG [Neisseriaceae bacterium]